MSSGNDIIRTTYGMHFMSTTDPPERIHRAAVPYRPTRFKHIVGVDLKWVKDSEGVKHIWFEYFGIRKSLIMCEPVNHTRFEKVVYFQKYHKLQKYVLIFLSSKAAVIYEQ